jgi:hypothetical protein
MAAAESDVSGHARLNWETSVPVSHWPDTGSLAEADEVVWF